MIVYKWVINQDNKNYPLRTFGVDGRGGIRNYLPYNLKRTYKTVCEIKSPYFKHQNNLNVFTACKGFHFWKTYTNRLLNNWNEFLKKQKQPTINICLKCEVKRKDIFIENDYQLVAKKFKVLKELIL